MVKNKEFFRINNKIKSPEVRITGDGIENRVVDLSEALDIASNMKMDLVEIVPNAKPPVVKVVEFQKFIYERKQKEKENKKSQKKTKVKEIRFTYNTGDHDFQFKLKHAINFLEKGDKVKAIVWFKGREIVFADQGELLLLRFVNDLKDYGKIETMPKLENKRMSIIITPKK